MEIGALVVGAIGIAILVYLFYALLFPENF